jgi:hypothetical protein
MYSGCEPMHFCALASSVNETKPKPRGRPVAPSSSMLHSVSVPNGSNVLRKTSDVALCGTLPTKQRDVAAFALSPRGMARLGSICNRTVSSLRPPGGSSAKHAPSCRRESAP